MPFDFTNNEKNDFKDKERCFKVLEHENKLFTTRVNLLLVAESLLFLSYVTTLGNPQINNCVVFTIGIIGLIITFLIGFVNIRASINLEKLKETIDDIYSFHKKMRQQRVFGSANIILGWILTIVFIIAWIVLLVLNTC